MDMNKDLPSINITLTDLKLKVRYYPSDKFDKDCSYDSKYMLSTMRRLSVAMRATYYWVRNDT